MFVVTSDLRDATLGVISSGSYFDSYTKDPVPQPTNVNSGYYALPSGSPHTNMMGGWWVKAGGSGNNRLRWNRMADGVLISHAPVGVASRCADFMGTATFQLTDWASVNNDSHRAVERYGGNLWMQYSTANIDGGAYKCAVARLGSGSQYEYDKYISPCISDFSLPTVSTPIVFDGWGSSKPMPNTYSPRKIRAKKIVSGSPNADYNVVMTWMIVAVPTGSAPTLTPIETDLGIITEPTSVTIQAAGTPSVSAKLDGSQTVQVSTSTGNFTVDLSTVWSGMSYGDHEIICVAEQNGYKTGARIRFTKSASAVMVTTKPHSSAARPASCRLVGNLVVPTGAVLTQEVTNNGNDASPTWEVYTGNEHFFSNETKTASQWGLAARVRIDNSDGNAVAEIKDSLAMGVLYEGGAE